ncbi:alpha/beta fold hydrolase [Dasania marina]|uniref:alpha/beta fold hydrolase n=1 Tax=Dasania marina TaxID=471499 RepID=UPI0030DB59ED|tara:strand:- start:36189 stop:37019 length:831 start_codon:yes stop_codon:yes gene_type:complete
MENMLKEYVGTLSELKYDKCGTAYVEEGEGDPVILIHGVGLSHAMWFAQSRALAKHFRVIRYDMLGHGGSCLPKVGVTIDDYVEQLLNLMQHLELTTSSIIGFSLGALVAQKFAIIHPSNLNRLVIMSSVFNRSDAQKLGVFGRALEVAVSGVKGTVDAATDRWFSPEFRRQQPQLIQCIREQLLQNDHMGYLRSYNIFATSDEVVRDGLSDIQCPTLVITGELDIGSTPDMAREMSEVIPHAKLMIVPMQRHMLPVEDAASTNKYLLNFLHGSDS